jgi:UDP-glucose 4-epimerase
MHFAAHIVVPESVVAPLKYYGNNTCASRNLLACAEAAGIKHFIFSSTAAVYGIPSGGKASEDTPTDPINPYGRSKLMTEWMLRDMGAASGLRHVILRYFNVAGADPGGRIGQCTPGATHLIKVACEAATGKREHIAVFGTDFPTQDGTGVRDYIHVDDLARAHLDALAYLNAGGAATTLNCGYGRGYSVREVLRMVEQISGVRLDVREEGPRAGDPPALVAIASRIRETLGWTPRLDDLETIVRTAYEWERKLARV